MSSNKTTCLQVSLQQASSSSCCIAQNIETNVDLAQSFLFYSPNTDTFTADRCGKTYCQGCTMPATVLQQSGLLRTQWDFMPNFTVCTHTGIKVPRSHPQLDWKTSEMSFHYPSNVKKSYCTRNTNSQQFIFLGLRGVFKVKITSSVGQRFILQTRSIGSKQRLQ